MTHTYSHNFVYMYVCVGYFTFFLLYEVSLTVNFFFNFSVRVCDAFGSILFEIIMPCNYCNFYVDVKFM